MKHLVKKITITSFVLFLAIFTISWKPIPQTNQTEGLEYVKLIEQDSYLIEGRAITFNVEYSAEDEREIFVQINGENIWIGKVKQKVPAGYNKRVKVTLVSARRIDPGKGFEMKLNLGVVGGTWKELIDKNRYKINLHKTEF